MQIQSKALFDSICAGICEKPYFVIRKINILGSFQSLDKKKQQVMSHPFLTVNTSARFICACVTNSNKSMIFYLNPC